MNMKLFTINYEIKATNAEYTVSIIALTKERAIDVIYGKVGSIKINTISTIDKIHVIDEQLINNIVGKSDKIQKYQQKIKQLNKIVTDYEHEVGILKERLNVKEQKPAISSKDIKEALRGKKKEEVKKPEPPKNKTTNESTGKKKVQHKCPYCDYKGTKRGVKIHITKKHPGKKNI